MKFGGISAKSSGRRLKCERMRKCWSLWAFLLLHAAAFCTAMLSDFPQERVREYREKVRGMFYHAYDSYLEHAYPKDELMPLTCQGMDTWGKFSLTLIDALDTLLIMGNETEFRRAVALVLENADTDSNVNVSVFETNIRVVGGLLSAHLMSGRVQGMERPTGWPCAGPLLDLAERFARKLLPAFNTETGMPFGTVNLRYGVNRLETPITCTAGVGTFIVEFGALSRLTGNPIFERVAMRALKALWKTRSGIGLVGNHINVQTGVWTATDSGIGAGVDSYFEYLAKGALLFHRPALMQQFKEYEAAINKHVRKEDWFTWVSMAKGQVNFPVFQSLEAFWPGVLALTGNVEDAARVMLTYDQVNRQYGVPPEFYNLPNREAVAKRAGYPLRPEIVESMMYLYRATDDPHYLHMGAAVVEAIEHSARTSCGYATIRDLTTRSLEDRMESFFLSETTKYLYLLFDPENFIHNDGTTARVITNPSGKCTVFGGGWIFNTEAHPIDPGALYCCGHKRQADEELLQRFKDSIDFVSLLDLEDPALQNERATLDEADLPPEVRDLRELRAEHEAAGVAEELHAYERRWNATDEPADGNETRADEEEEAEEEPSGAAVKSVVEKPAQPLVPTVQAAEASGRESKERDGERKRRRRRKKPKNPIPPDAANENEARAAVRKQIKDLVGDLSKTERSAGGSGDSVNLLALLNELGGEFSGLMKTTERLQRIAASKNPTEFAALRRRLLERRVTNLVPIDEVLCEDCCVLTDQERDSVALRSMLNAIYGKHVYRRAGFPSAPGPLCRRWDAPDPSADFQAEIPLLEQLEGGDEEPNVVDHFSFASFAYRKLAAEHNELLSTPPRPFESLLQGNGHVLLGPRY